jgi:hypothetical protein
MVCFQQAGGRGKRLTAAHPVQEGKLPADDHFQAAR